MVKHLFKFCVLFSLLLFFDIKPVCASTCIEKFSDFFPEDDVYIIATGDNNSMALEIRDNSDKAGANVQIGKNISSCYQQYAIFKEYDGWYTIRNIGSQHNLDVVDGCSEPRTNLQQWIPHTHDAQKFRFFDAGNNEVFIQSKTGTFVDLANGDTTQGTNVQLFSFNGSSAQKWHLIPISQELTSLDIADGNYYICSKLNENLVLDIYNSSKVAGSNLILNKHSRSKSQIYRIELHDDGWYTIKNIYSNLYLDIKDANKTSGPVLRQWMGTGLNSQKFRFYYSDNNGILIKSKYEMSLGASSNNIDSDIIVTTTLYTETEDQKWILIPF